MAMKLSVLLGNAVAPIAAALKKTTNTKKAPADTPDFQPFRPKEKSFSERRQSDPEKKEPAPLAEAKREALPLPAAEPSVAEAFIDLFKSLKKSQSFSKAEPGKVLYLKQSKKQSKKVVLKKGAMLDESAE